jgi:hypothetical protein
MRRRVNAGYLVKAGDYDGCSYNTCKFIRLTWYNEVNKYF